MTKKYSLILFFLSFLSFGQDHSNEEELKNCVNKEVNKTARELYGKAPRWREAVSRANKK